MSEEIEVTQDLLNQVINLTKELQPLSQGAFGFFTTKTRHAISYSDPVTREKVQKELDHAVSLLAISHVMTIFENAFPKEYWEGIIIDNDDFNRVMAYKHLRSCTANGFTGNRCDDSEHEYFNNIMGSTNTIEGVISFDNNKIFLAESAGNFAHTFLVGLMNKIIVELHKRIT